MSTRWVAAVAFAAVVTATAAVHARIPAEPRANTGGEAFVPDPEVARFLSLGFDSVVGDFHWLRAVQITGSEAADPSQNGPVLGRLVDVVTTLDPWVDHPYRFAAIWMTNSEQSVRKANELLERGIEHHPDDWRMSFYKGFNHFFYLDEQEEAVVELERAASLSGSPRYLPRLVARLRSHAADIEEAALFLQQVIRDAPDDAARAEYQAALDEIEVERAARFLDRARGAFQQLTGRDVERVEDLLIGPAAVLRSLPPAEPRSLPEALRRGSRWELDPDSGRIQSTYYGRRYEVNFDPVEQRRRKEWKARRDLARETEQKRERETDGG